jgi:hypothetical protein
MSEQEYKYAMCQAGCGCLWRNNGDGTISLGGRQSRSCSACEHSKWDELVPLCERPPFAISADEMEAFDRFRETCEDDQDYDVSVVMMKRLAEIGLVRRVTRNIYETTAFGMAVASGRINIRDYQQGKSDGVAEMAAELKRLCKDFSDRQNRPYMADVHAAIDGLTEQLLEHTEPPTSLQRPAPGEA